MQGTVTISLSEYEALKQSLEAFKKQAEEGGIIKIEYGCHFERYYFVHESEVLNKLEEEIMMLGKTINGMDDDIKDLRREKIRLQTENIKLNKRKWYQL